MGRYEIVSALGSGGMAEVYAARDSRLGREVAIKVLSTRLQDDKGLRERLEREARAASSLNHPGICTIYDIGEHEGHPYIVMERLAGRALDERLRKGPLEANEILDIAVQLTDALAAAHASGIVHRDIKPANVFLLADGRVKVLDFGIAKVSLFADLEVDGEAPTVGATGVTLPGTTLGTCAYMSPEQARGDEVDARTDVFSLGVLLYEAATGTCPFARETAGRTLEAVLTVEPEPVRSLRSDLSEGLERALERALEKDRDLRYQNAVDLRAEIKRLQRDTGHQLAASSPKASSPSRRLLAPAAIGLAAVALTVGVTFWPEAALEPVGPGQWEQLTFFTDSVTSPALSPDGRMIAYLRGPATFVGPADLYVQMLPGGDPTPLTGDGLPKMDPHFSPDGNRIAFSNGLFSVSTVPVLGGEPQPLVDNASALTWVEENRVMFSEFREGVHMAVITSSPSRTDVREVYVPPTVSGMAHRSYLSPDGQWVLVVEMLAGWIPCRVVPADGSTLGEEVGPPGAPCTSGAWSPDGRYVYLTIEMDGENHIWRQRYPGGEPEQVTAGPTREEGVAMAADGKSFITAVGTVSSAVYVNEGEGERQVSFQGDGMMVSLSPDGRTLYYVERRTGSTGVLMSVDLDTDRRGIALPGFRMPVEGRGLSSEGLYDISPDGRRIVFVAVGEDGEPELWLASLGGSGSPVRLPADEPDVVRLSSDGWIYVQDRVDNKTHIFRMREDGSERQLAIESPVVSFGEISADGEWLMARMGFSGGDEDEAPETGIVVASDTSVLAYKLDGREAPVTICESCFWAKWGSEGDYLYIQTEAGGTWRGVRIPEGRVLPELPEGGVRHDDDSGLSALVLEGGGAFFGVSFSPGHDPTHYAVGRQNVHRNLYRIPIQ